jgi:hypothetical protein
VWFHFYHPPIKKRPYIIQFDELRRITRQDYIGTLFNWRMIEVKPHWILGIAGASIIIAGIAGFILGSPAALVGGGVFSFAIIFAFVYWYFDIRPSSRTTSDEDEEDEPASDINEVRSYDPEIERIRGDEFLNESDIVNEYMESFGISKDKAQNLYDAGYSHWGDFSEAIPEDLLMVEGINPTISRRIISVVRSKM